MMFDRLEGSHSGMGREWGRRLRESGVLLERAVPFPVTRERRAFAEACLPHYREHFPRALEELRGLADGQGCGEEFLRAALFSIYAMPPGAHCSCFAVSSGEAVLLGRNSDFLTAQERGCCHLTCRPAEGYAFLGNTTSFIQMEDGVNQRGLAVGLTSAAPGEIRPGLNAGMLLRLMLDTCASTAEALALLERVPIASAQTFTLADPSGEIAVAECCALGMKILRPAAGAPFVCAVNRFESPEMRPLSGPCPDDWEAGPRLAVMKSALARLAPSINEEEARAILSGQHGFLCQYDRRTGRDTVWAAVYDLKGRVCSLAPGNPGRCGFPVTEGFPQP